MKYKWLALLLLITLSMACSNVSDIRKEIEVEATPLPTYQSSQLPHTSFFTEISDYPKIDELTDFCKTLIDHHENDWNALTDAFESEFEKEHHIYFTFDYEEYSNHGVSYLFKEGVQNSRLLHEPITDNTALGKIFYSYLVNHGEIPFHAVYNFSGRASMIGYVAEAYAPDIAKCVSVWFVRGCRDDALAIDSAFLTEPICWKITIVPLNDDWFIYYQTRGDG